MKDLIAAVRSYAEAHYTDGGWDFIVEAWSDEDIAHELDNEGATTFEEALKALAPIIDVYAERQADARIEGADPERVEAPPVLTYNRPLTEREQDEEDAMEAESHCWWLFQDVSPDGSQAIWYGQTTHY